MRPIYYDTETTGIRPGKDHVIELAAYDPFREKTFCSLIHPGCPIPPEASAISHITDEMVKNAPPFPDVARDFLTFCEGDIVLIAHNAGVFWPRYAFIKRPGTIDVIIGPTIDPTLYTENEIQTKVKDWIEKTTRALPAN